MILDHIMGWCVKKLEAAIPTVQKILDSIKSQDYISMAQTVQSSAITINLAFDVCRSVTKDQILSAASSLLNDDQKKCLAYVLRAVTSTFALEPFIRERKWMMLSESLKTVVVEHSLNVQRTCLGKF